MTSSVYQQSSNGAPKHINGSNTTGNLDCKAKQIEGTTLKCLEDPSFEFDSIPKPAPRKPSYRVLEDPYEVEKRTSEQINKVSTYKVLEDPMMASVYESNSSGLSGSMQSSRYFESSAHIQDGKL